MIFTACVNSHQSVGEEAVGREDEHVVAEEFPQSKVGQAVRESASTAGGRHHGETATQIIS